jgi:hypothetical protein
LNTFLLRFYSGQVLLLLLFCFGRHLLEKSIKPAVRGESRGRKRVILKIKTQISKLPDSLRSCGMPGEKGAAQNHPSMLLRASNLKVKTG